MLISPAIVVGLLLATGVSCEPQTGAVRHILGGEPISRPHTDITESAILVPSLRDPILEQGVLARWQIYAVRPGATVQLQVWSPDSNNRFHFKASTVVDGVTEGITNLSLSDPLAVDRGDVLALYFPTFNPVPYDLKECYQQEDQLRYYVTDTAFKPSSHTPLTFSVAPLAAQPCRNYSIQATVYKLLPLATTTTAVTGHTRWSTIATTSDTGHTRWSTIATTPDTGHTQWSTSTTTTTPGPAGYKTTTTFTGAPGPPPVQDPCDPTFRIDPTNPGGSTQTGGGIFEAYLDRMNGEDKSGCSSADTPCRTLRYILSTRRRHIGRTIIVVNREEENVEYVMDLPSVTKDIPAYLNFTQLLSATINGSTILTFKNSTINSNSRELVQTIAFRGVTMRGDLNIECTRQTLKLIFTNVDMGESGYSSRISVSHCVGINLEITNSSFVSTEFIFDGYFSKVSIRNSLFMGTDYIQQWNDKDTIHSYILLKNIHRCSSAIINITNTKFIGNQPIFHPDLPVGAFSVLMDKPKSVLDLFIDNCTFTNNSRAIDLSLRGNNRIAISRCTFNGNEASGAGGAIRISPTMSRGFNSLKTEVEKATIVVADCIFTSNLALTTSEYAESDLYFPVRAPGSGGAVYVFISLPSYLPSSGRLDVINCTFLNNSANAQGGSIFFSPKLSAKIAGCRMTSPTSAIRSQTGDILATACDLTMEQTVLKVLSSEGTLSVISYQASEPLAARLDATNVSLHCSQGYKVKAVNTTRSVSFGLESLHVYCQPCPDKSYSLEESVLEINGVRGQTNDISCQTCPYGAECREGIRNKENFWGSRNSLSVVMYVCPEGYCQQPTNTGIAYDYCADNRAGRLCGRCNDGYSESIFGKACVPNSNCGFHHWYIVLLIVLYSVLYVLCFMFENEWTRLIRYLLAKIKRKGTHIEGKRDVADSGYFPIFMFFIQTASLLKIKIVIDNDNDIQYIHRPDELIPDFLIEGIKELFGFDVLQFHTATCLYPDLTPVAKITVKAALIVSLYLILLLIYLGSCCCCRFCPMDCKSKIGYVNPEARMLSTVVALFLYTYQGVAESALALLNCTPVNGDMVLFPDGNIACFQPWQIGILIGVCTFVFPFFVILLFAPKLLKRGRLSLGLFFLSMIFPLFLMPYIIVLLKKDMRHIDTLARKDNATDSAANLGRQVQELNSDGAKTEGTPSVKCCGKKEDGIDGVLDRVMGPYRDDVIGGVCWEGITNFNRLLLVLLATFVTNILIRQVFLTFVCFLMLMMHLKNEPFKQKYANLVESVSLSLLLLISSTNVVRAVFFRTGFHPRGDEYIFAVVYEWVEIVILSFLPLFLLGVVLFALLFKSAVVVVSKIGILHTSGDEATDEDRAIGRVVKVSDETDASYCVVMSELILKANSDA